MHTGHRFAPPRQHPKPHWHTAALDFECRAAIAVQVYLPAIPDLMNDPMASPVDVANELDSIWDFHPPNLDSLHFVEPHDMEPGDFAAEPATIRGFPAAGSLAHVLELPPTVFLDQAGNAASSHIGRQGPHFLHMVVVLQGPKTI